MKYYSILAGSVAGGVVSTLAHGWQIGVASAVIAFAFTSLLWMWLDKKHEKGG